MKFSFKYLFFFLTLLLAISSLAQKNVIQECDSLMRLLPLAKHDTIRIRLLDQIATTWNSRNPAKARQYFDQAIAIAKQSNNSKLLVGLKIGKGYLYGTSGESAKAIQILQEAILLADPTKDKYAIHNAQIFIGLAYQSQGDFDNAFKYIQSCYDFYAKEYKKQGNKHDSSSLNLIEGITGSNMSLGAIYLDMGKLDSAKYYLNEAHRLLKMNKNNNRYFTFFIPKSLATIYLKQQQPKQAKPYIDEALSKATLYSDTTGLVLVWAEMATYYQQINQLDSAIIYAQKSVITGMKIKRFEAVLQSGKFLKKYFEQNNNSDNALYYSNLILAVQDSVSSIEKVKQGQRLLYEELQSQQSIAQLEIDNKNRLIRYGLGAGLLLLALLAIMLWLGFDRKQKENKNLDTKIKLQESEFSHKLAETEMTALRAQMNPHFIFNCLNSIKLYTLENDGLTATDYLTKFSRLIRLVLENSRSERITLANELETLELYIAMEAMRFKNKVAYKINVADDVDTDYIEIPPLLIQPYVENAVWHGLMHKEGGGMILIDVKTTDSILQISITDNGVGRAAAAALKSKSATNQKSFGLKMTSERIELINELYKTNTQVKIEDLAVGTRVIIEIPI